MNAPENRDATVKFYKDYGPGANGAFTTWTTCDEADDFLRLAAEQLPCALRHTVGDEEFTMTGILPQICEIWAKLKGYRADRVFEERLLIIGQPHPERTLTCLNQDVSE